MTADPERIRSVALMLDGFTVPEKVTVIVVGDGGDADGLTVGLELRRRRAPARCVTTRKAPPTGMPPVPSNSKAPDVARSVAGEAEASSWDRDLRVAEEVGRDRRALPRRCRSRPKPGQLEVGVDEEVRRTIRARAGGRSGRRRPGCRRSCPGWLLGVAAVVPRAAELKPLPRVLAALVWVASLEPLP